MISCYARVVMTPNNDVTMPVDVCSSTVITSCVYYLCRGYVFRSVCRFVCLCICLLDYSKSYAQILMKFFGVDPLIRFFDGDPGHDADPGIF